MKQPTTPSTPTIAPISADRTGTARRPRPGSTARRDPIASAGGSPACAAHLPAVDGDACRDAGARTRPRAPTTIAIASTATNDGGGREPEHDPVGVEPDVEVVAARLADREARRQRDRDADADHDADRGGEDRRQHQRANRDPAVGADRAPGRRGRRRPR